MLLERNKVKKNPRIVGLAGAVERDDQLQLEPVHCECVDQRASTHSGRAAETNKAETEKWIGQWGKK